MTVEAPPRMTPSEFLDWAEGQVERYEYADGRPRMMAGAGPRHNAITPVLAGLVYPHFRPGAPCRFRDAGQRLWVRRSERYYLPDGMIACPPRLVDRQSIDNPTVIFEVLSPGTESYDRGEKWDDYELIESVREIVHIYSAQREVNVYRRTEPGGEWSFRPIRSGVIPLRSVGIDLDFEAIYAEWNEIPEGLE